MSNSGVESTSAPPIVVVRRPAGIYCDRFRAYDIYVDDRQVGQLRRDSELVVRPTVGDHIIRAEIDWCASEEVNVHLTHGDQVTLRVEPSGNFLQLYQLFGRGRYLTLSVLDD